MADTPYDAVPYTSFPYPETHPDRLRLVAHLFHLAPAPVDGCRVLEIGCASGGNLVPMAEALPGSRFLGIDLAPSAIADGNEVVRALGLDNLELRALDLTELPADAGRFDYIIAHGVYSWVPNAVKAALLDLVARHLAPDGVAYLSHNVKPGWYARQAAREMMLFHVGALDDPGERVEQARAVLAFVARGALGATWADTVREQFETAARQPDWMLFHDGLAAVNDACWFHEVAGELARRDLQYLGDAELGSMLPTRFDEATRATLEVVASDEVRHQQYLDFLDNRAFRMTLVVHGDRKVDRALAPEQAQGLHFAAAMTEGSDGKFRTPNGGVVTISRESTRAALRALAVRAPGSLSWAELGGDQGDRALGGDLLQLVVERFVQGTLTPARCAAAAGLRPRAPAHARLAARRAPFVTSLRHQNVRLTPELQALLPALDGKNDRAALLAGGLAPDAAALEAALGRIAELALVCVD
jgi:SAM-dependent methyltransferase